ncbi:hypothetical protein C492_14721 [Natronococcus jeotgali DSM 18795]|uniref:Uncharacterized protein n=1 Tax=Natronococcus jeotgali DSM 18795 TaxID=1227498 RepID=L9X3L7_9EURY|nr:hypothetical protein C492_14721 [Natronococcus jeotgali DSM 18795]
MIAGCSDDGDENGDTAPEDEGTSEETGDDETDPENESDTGDDGGNETNDDGTESDGESETSDDGNETDGENETDGDEDEFEGEEADEENEESNDESEDGEEGDDGESDEAEDDGESDDESGGEEELDPGDYENEIVNDSPLEVAAFEVGDGCELTARITRPDGETARIRYDFVVYYGDEVLAESRNNDYELDGDDASHRLTAVLEDCDEATHFGFKLHGYEAIERAGDDIEGYVAMAGGTDNVFSVQSHSFDGQNCQVEVEVYNETPEEITGFIWVNIQGDRDAQEESTEIPLEAGGTETVTFGAENCGNVRTYSVRGDVIDQ